MSLTVDDVRGADRLHSGDLIQLYEELTEEGLKPTEEEQEVITAILELAETVWAWEHGATLINERDFVARHIQDDDSND